MTVQASEGNHKKGLLSGLLGGGKTIWVVAVVLALFVVGGALQILGSAAATQTYYVLGRNVAARTQIDPSMLVAREAKVGEAPPNALDQSDVSNGQVFSKYALQAGDVVSTSNAGALDRITADVPDNFVAASFSAQPEIAVAGKVRTGDFIDIIGSADDATKGTVAKVMLAHVLVLDVTVSPNSIAQNANSGQEGTSATNPGPESEAARSGIPSVYTVAVSEQDATKLALLRSANLYVVLSGNVPDETTTAETNSKQLASGAVSDSSAGTFGSIYIKRWDVAFTPGNVYVDSNGNVWKVNNAKVWATPTKTLAAGDTPPGYLNPEQGLKFTDAKGVYWIVDGHTDNDGALVWYSPEQKKALSDGDNPDGFDPHALYGENDDTAKAAQ